MNAVARTQPRSAASPEPDGATLAAAARGDAAACRAVVERYQRSVYALAWRMLASSGRRSLAEDLTQEAFLRVFRSLPRFDPAGPARLSTWILKIATRTVIDELRRVRPLFTPLDGYGSEAPRADRPDVHAEHASLGRAIARAADLLSPEVRATFVLRAYHDLSYPEIADTLEVDVGTVKSRLWRARRALQQQLQEVR